jgi:dTMP kinase
MPRGTFIAIEGIDGSGKHTQAERLGQAFTARGIPWVPFSFPRYESSFGKLIARFLNGEFGSLEAVDAHLSALLYAGDRFEAKPELEAALAAGKSILTDRYVASNLAHQTARVAPERRAEFITWLRRLEYGIYGLPAEDLVIYLRMGAREAQRLVGQKAPREYTALGHDLQESDLTHLERAAQVYDRLATGPNWVTVECLDAATGGLKSVEEIHRAVLLAVDSRAVLPVAVS